MRSGDCTPTWLDHFVESVCDDSCVLPTSALGSNASHRLPPVDGNHYAKQHDCFLDSLLQEQVAADVDHNDANCSISTQSINSWTMNSPAGSSLCESESTGTSSTSRKRRRPVRLRRKASPLRPKSSNHRIHGLQTIHLDELSERNPPHYYLHSNCRIQKDKGKGETIGSKICGKTAEACLSKLRAKIALLTEHCTTPSASMKRRPATVSKITATYCETRSLLTLRMGFLSMTYGILLRWDVVRTHKVSLVVLRKNCHESFYKSSVPTSSISAWFPEPQHPPKLSETRVTVLYASGFKKTKNHWSVRLSLADETENILLTHDEDQQRLVPKRNASITGSSDELVVQLIEHLRHTRHLRTTLRVPTASLSHHPAELRIPCPDGGLLQLEAVVREWETASGARVVSEEPVVDASQGWEWMLCMVC